MLLGDSAEQNQGIKDVGFRLDQLLIPVEQHGFMLNGPIAGQIPIELMEMSFSSGANDLGK